MSEGLVLLDRKGVILSINPAAQKIFHAGSSCVGQDFLVVDRDHEINLAIQTALEGGHSEIRAVRNDREAQFDISRITADGAVAGTVLLAFCVGGAGSFTPLMLPAVHSVLILPGPASLNKKYSVSSTIATDTYCPH